MRRCRGWVRFCSVVDGSSEWLQIARPVLQWGAAARATRIRILGGSGKRRGQGQGKGRVWASGRIGGRGAVRRRLVLGGGRIGGRGVGLGVGQVRIAGLVEIVEVVGHSHFRTNL